MIDQAEFDTPVGRTIGMNLDYRNNGSERSSAITRKLVMVHQVSARYDLDPTGS